MIRFFAFIAVFIMAGPVLAQEWPTLSTATPPELPAPVKEAQEQGAQARYLGRHEEYHGWMVFNKGRPTFTYTTDAGKAFFQGMLFSSTGENITMKQLQNAHLQGANSFDALSQIGRMTAEKLNNPEAESSEEIAEQLFEEPSEVVESEQVPTAPKELTKADKLMLDLENANWALIGARRAPHVYALIDPKCPHCRKTMRDLKPMIDSGALQVRMLPIGFDEVSQRVSALFLAALDPKTLYYQYIDGKQPDLGQDPSVNTQGILRNYQLMEQWSFDITPILFYRAHDGEVKIVRGSPKDYDSIMKDLTGL